MSAVIQFMYNADQISIGLLVERNQISFAPRPHESSTNPIKFLGKQGKSASNHFGDWFNLEISDTAYKMKASRAVRSFFSTKADLKVSIAQIDVNTSAADCFSTDYETK